MTCDSFIGRNNNTSNPCAHVPSADNEDVEYYQRVFNLTSLICFRVLCPIILAFGVPTNIINIVVLTRKWMRSSTNIYLTAVAISDTVYLLLFFFNSLDYYPGLRGNSTYGFFKKALVIGKPSCNLFSNIATWLTCTFTIERYIAVSNPMLGRKLCTRKRARIVTFVVSIIAFCLTFPDFLFVRVCERWPKSNETNALPTYSLTKTVVYRKLSHLGWIYLNQLLFVFAPLLVLGVSNGLLIRSVLRARRERCHLTQGDTCRAGVSGEVRQRSAVEQQRITVMLIVVVLVFCVLQLPSAVSMVIIALVKTKTICINTPLRYRFKAMGATADLMIMLNAAINFLLYSAFSLKFRRTFQRMLLECLHRVGYRRQPGRGSAELLGATVTGAPWPSSSSIRMNALRGPTVPAMAKETANNGYYSIKTGRSPQAV